MLQMRCSCGELLGNKQLIYETELQNACESAGLDYDALSKGLIDSDPIFVKAKSDVTIKLCKRYCCRQALTNYVDTVQLIKG